MTDPTMRDDLDLVIGGAFSPDEIGPEAYEAVAARVRANPAPYLQAVEESFLGARFDALAQARLHLPRLFELLHGTDPDVRRVARDLLRHYESALLIYDQAVSRDALDQALPEETVNLLIRLDDRRRTLRVLLERED